MSYSPVGDVLPEVGPLRVQYTDPGPVVGERVPERLPSAVQVRRECADDVVPQALTGVRVPQRPVAG